MRRVLLVLVISLFVSLPLCATTYTVNNLGDGSDTTPGDDICSAAGVCTLRAAIEEANAHAGADRIAFSVAGTISPGTAYPTITGVLEIDGTTAPGYLGGIPVVIVDGAFSSATGFVFNAGTGGSLFEGMHVGGFSAAGVRLMTGAVTVRANFIGGLFAASPNQIGIDVQGSGHTIGGSAAGDGNLISDNQGVGIDVTGSNHVIRDNTIGADAGGMAADPNNGGGIRLHTGATGVTIGGAAGLENLISGNSNYGIRIEDSNTNTVAGNFIGTMLGGVSPLGNGPFGIIIVNSTGNTIGTATLRNIIGDSASSAILLSPDASANTIQNNYIGVDSTGNGMVANSGTGIEDQGDNNLLGTAIVGNVIGNNGGDGILLETTASGTLIRRNIIGLNAGGTAISGNGGFGISVLPGATQITIGGTAANEGNVISGNADTGIDAEMTNSTIAGNIIGLNAAGNDTRGNGGHGVHLHGGSNNTVGGTNGRNIISGNSSNGVMIDAAATGMTISNNYIGTDITGALDQGNLSAGLELCMDAVTNTVSGNVISGNDFLGVLIVSQAMNNTLFGNIIGRNAANTGGLPNAFGGVALIDASFNTIGSVALGGNVIASNGGDGVMVGIGQSNTIVANSIFDNSLLGIDLFGDGVTENDLNDPDEGPHNFQNFPLIDAAVSSATASSVQGTINSNPSTALTLHFYSSPAADGSGNGEGQVYLGTVGVTTDGAGNASYNFTGPAVTAGHVVTATATGAFGTSEFSDFEVVVTAPTVQFSAANYPAAAESGTVTITVTRTGDLTAASTVNYTTSNGTAVQPGDYTTASGTLTFAAGDASETFDVTIASDTLDEPSETINLALSLPTAASLGAQSTATITIADDDLPPSFTISDPVAQNEGNAGTTSHVFNVTLSAPSAFTVNVDYATANNTATAPSDFTAIPATTLTFLPGGPLTQQVTVTASGDTIFEPTETFFVNLSNAVNASIADSQGIGTLTNDDAQPNIIIGNFTGNETNAGTTTFTFTVSLSNGSASNVTVNYETANDTATAGSDYTGVPATTLTFLPGGPLSQNVSVTVAGDTIFEPTETFFVNLSNAIGGTITDPQGLGTITNDDAQPNITIDSFSANETNGGTTNFTFNVSLSNGSASNVTVNYQTANNTATAGSDYTAVPATTLTFVPGGPLTQQVTVSVTGDMTNEPTETFFVNLSNAVGGTITVPQGTGTIVNDDGVPSITINDVPLAEGNVGNTPFVFTVTLSNASASTITVNYATANGTALSGSDYTAVPTTTLTFLPGGPLSQQVTVNVTGDTTNEPNETFFVDLSNATNASIADTQGIGTINNDDGVPTISINDVPLAEGNAGTTPFTFNVTLSNPSSSTITVQYATGPGTGTAGTDYTTVPLTALTFNPGVVSQPVTVNVTGDLVTEVNETFFVNLSNAVNATIADPQGIGTINNDDAAPTISINDVPLAEGNAGTTAFTFNVTLSNPSSSAITVDYATAPGTATAGTDYTTVPTTTLTFNAGEVTRPVTVNVAGDAGNEPDETFFVNLTNASNATIADPQGIGTITNDDAVATADVGITKDAQVLVASIRYTIVVTNAGPGAADAVTVTDVLPVGTTFVSATPTQGSCSGTTTVICSLGTIASGASATIDLRVGANAQVIPQNTATVSSTTPDPNLANNSATSSDPIPTLPEWAMMVLAGLLLFVAVRKLQ